MPDEKTEGQPPQAPVIDMKALGDTIRAGVQQAVSDIARAQQSQPAPPPQAQPKTDPIADAVLPSILPILKPIADNLDLQARASYDATLFYTTTPQAHKHMAEIEKKFAEMPRRRAQIWNEIRGERFDEFHKEQLAEEQEAQKRAALALTIGSGAPRGFDGGPPIDPFDMTDEQMLAAVDPTKFAF